jgi:hypothetical protein
MAIVHLHRDDVPDTLALLGALLGDRSTEVPGYRLDETGADVDWDLLLEGGLATTEKAVVHIAHGCAMRRVLKATTGSCVTMTRVMPNSAFISWSKSSTSAPLWLE